MSGRRCISTSTLLLNIPAMPLVVLLLAKGASAMYCHESKGFLKYIKEYDKQSTKCIATGLIKKCYVLLSSSPKGTQYAKLGCGDCKAMENSTFACHTCDTEYCNSGDGPLIKPLLGTACYSYENAKANFTETLRQLVHCGQPKTKEECGQTVWWDRATMIKTAFLGCRSDCDAIAAKSEIDTGKSATCLPCAGVIESVKPTCVPTEPTGMAKKVPWKPPTISTTVTPMASTNSTVPNNTTIDSNTTSQATSKAEPDTAERGRDGGGDGGSEIKTSSSPKLQSALGDSSVADMTAKDWAILGLSAFFIVILLFPPVFAGIYNAARGGC